MSDVNLPSNPRRPLSAGNTAPTCPQELHGQRITCYLRSGAAARNTRSEQDSSIPQVSLLQRVDSFKMPLQHFFRGPSISCILSQAGLKEYYRAH